MADKTYTPAQAEAGSGTNDGNIQGSPRAVSPDEIPQVPADQFSGSSPDEEPRIGPQDVNEPVVAPPVTADATKRPDPVKRKKKRLAAAKKKKMAEKSGNRGGIAKPANDPVVNPKTVAKPRARKRRYFGRFSFLLLVLIPTILAGYYYSQIASDQYQSEMRFAVRGTVASPAELLGFTALPGASNQGADAYIVIDYMTSTQMLLDIRDQVGIDVRQFFVKEEIDPLYRVEADMPWQEFVRYWNWMAASDFNATTGITTFRVNAFSAEDARAISEAVLTVAAKLVNDLSSEARDQLIQTAQTEVLRTERRLADARNTIREFRDREQSLDPTQQAASGQELIQGLQRELIDLKARRAALTSTVSTDSPSVRVLDRQIAALTDELDEQLRNFGSGGDLEDDQRNLSAVLKDYSDLILEQEFAEKAYTSALSSLETSQAEARKQERYFAIVVNPTLPDVALFPLRVINTIIAFVVFIIVWLLIFLVVQAVRDHSV